jgi:hypothetical protein
LKRQKRQPETKKYCEKQKNSLKIVGELLEKERYEGVKKAKRRF